MIVRCPPSESSKPRQLMYFGERSKVKKVGLTEDESQSGMKVAI